MTSVIDPDATDLDDCLVLDVNERFVAACAALAGILARHAVGAEWAASEAVQYADCLLAELSVEEEEE